MTSVWSLNLAAVALFEFRVGGSTSSFELIFCAACRVGQSLVGGCRRHRRFDAGKNRY